VVETELSRVLITVVPTAHTLLFRSLALFTTLVDSSTIIMRSESIMIGFLLMMGGKSDDPNVFNPEIFSFRRITLAPIVVLFGFVFEIWAIMKKPKTEEQD